MSFLSALFNIIIRPLIILFEYIYGIAYSYIGNHGLTIIVLSLAVNFLVLPLYHRADAIQREDQEMQKKLSHWVDHIKRTFKGDERYMMTQFYYRQNNYSALHSLRGSISLFLQIPFFIAAYRFLSEYAPMKGVSFGPIADLGAPDGLIRIAGHAIHLLPILMTVINLVSGMVYSKGTSLRDKIQVFGLAAVFFVLLYNSPAGLVFYWTLNQVFSLAKNLFAKMKDPKRMLLALAGMVGLALAVVALLNPTGWSAKVRIGFGLIALLLIAPLCLSEISGNRVKKLHVTRRDDAEENNPSVQRVFLVCTVALTVLLGVLIPASVLQSSPLEFVNPMHPKNPLRYVFYSVCIAGGVFLLWFRVFYAMANKKGKRIMALASFLLLIIAIVNFMFFGRNLGSINAELKFVNPWSYSWKYQLLNAAVLSVILIVAILIWKKSTQKTIIRGVASVGLVLILCLSVVNIFKIRQVYAASKPRLMEESQTEMPRFDLSRTGKNVVVIMLDRAIGPLVPYLMQEKPELKEQFDGFTWYANTTSYGPLTNIAIPALLGGYEYTPQEMDKRDDVLIPAKHDEALKVVPVLFWKSGYKVTLCDPTYAGYVFDGDLSVFDEYDGMDAFKTKGYFLWDDENRNAQIESIRERHFFCYSLFKCSPVLIQHKIYNNGEYYNNGTLRSDIREDFLAAYTTLSHMKDMTHISDDGNNYLLFTNDTTHDVMELQKPDYIPVGGADNTEYDEAHPEYRVYDGVPLRVEEEIQASHYDCNMAAMLKLGEWFDHLRDEGVYENTRIILVSDHGHPAAMLDSMISESGIDAMEAACLLMEKDFAAKGFTVSEEFMTNADTPLMAMEGLIERPINPFTGKELTDRKKSEPVQFFFDSRKWHIEENQSYTYDREGAIWYSVHDDMRVASNWERVEDPVLGDG